ncbi:MAG: sulfatase family protein [Planctomycetota bacterium]|jgi:arylsulfatase A-like enzyme
MSRPNLVFIYTDEQAHDTLAAYGNSQIRMPNLDRLAAESVVFERAYVTQPVCTPSRSTLLTGLWPHTNGCTENNVPLRPEIPCLPEMLPEGEYVTGHFGKWHLGDELFAQHGFDEWVSIEDMYNRHFTPGRDRGATSSYHDFLIAEGLTPQRGERFGRGEAARFPEHLGKPAFLAREASDFIRRHRDQPFALYVNFLEPHMPFFGPRNDQHDVDAIPLPPNFAAELGEDNPLKARLLAEHFRRKGFGGQSLRSENDWRRMICNYWGLCSLVDTHAGAILETLDDCGLREDTIVVFTSDHGDMMGSHRLLAKCVMFEEAVRVPMMMRMPGRRAGRVTGPFSQIDVVPTLLDLMGQPIPEGLPGRSRRALLEAGGGALDEPVFVEWNGPNNGLGDVSGSVQIPEWMTAMAEAGRIRAATTDPVRTVISPDGWKLNCSPLGEHELYDLGADPGETRNVFETESARARELRADLAAWQDRAADAVALPGF